MVAADIATSSAAVSSLMTNSRSGAARQLAL